MGMSIETVIARESIREALAQYSMLLDGDGVAPNYRKWADDLFTADAVFVLKYPNGVDQERYEGREAVFKRFGRAGSPASAGRHFMVNTVFDEVTPTSAKTRTSALIQVSQRDTECEKKPGGLNGGKPIVSFIIVYHDTWVLDGGAWKKKLSVLHRDT
jgi:hypothetical protein